MHARPLALALLFTAALPACDAPAPLDCSDGWEGCVCHDDGECGFGLVCSDETICVDPAAIADPLVEPEGRAIDLLLVVDDSASMGARQAEIARSIEALIEPLAAEGTDLRIAITTTDRGNPQCAHPVVSTPEAGRAVLRSCRADLDAFASPLEVYGDQSAACTRACALDSIEVTPTATLADPSLRARPWIESSSSATNLSNIALGDALACAIPQGVSGCGFEAPLDAVRLFLDRSADPQDAAFDFLRAEADFVAVIVSDEADCSANTAVVDEVFGGSHQPTSATCWAAGVHCEGEACEPISHDINGRTTQESEAAVLVPVEDYVDDLAVLREQKHDEEAEVFVFGLVGVPEGYRGAMDYLPGPNPDDPESFQGQFGIGPGCGTLDDGAVPPVRMRAVLENPALGTGERLFSVCADDYRPALRRMAEVITAPR